MSSARLTITRFVATVLMALTILGGGALATAPAAAAFSGHGCSRATCQFFTSSYGSSVYYYNRKTCSEWESLTPKYLQGFKTSTALLADYPYRKLHKRC
jgi:hypothetical protein